MKKNDFSYERSHYSAALILENGLIFWGYGLGPKKTAIAELCFNTSMSGYQEVLTDPSYAKQIITFTFPHIGIVGTNHNDNESKISFASGCVLSEDIDKPSNWRSKISLDKWLDKKGIPCITNIDTRFLTRLLSIKGAKKAALVNFGKKDIDIDNIKKRINNWSGLEKLDLALKVSTKKPYYINEGAWDHKKNKTT